MYPLKISSATHSSDTGPIRLLPIQARLPNSPCRTVNSVVLYLPYKSLAAPFASAATLIQHKKCPQIAQLLCNLSPLDATLLSHLLCVANKELAQYLSVLDATLTRNRGWGYPGRGTSFAVQVDATSLCSMSAHQRPVILRASDEDA